MLTELSRSNEILKGCIRHLRQVFGGREAEHDYSHKPQFSFQAKYDKFLLSSRLIALRVEEREHLEGNGPDAKENGGGNDDDDDDDCVSNVNNKSAPSNSTSPHGRLEYRSSGSGGVGVDQLDEKRLENDVSVFLTTIFWLLEKTRVDKQVGQDTYVLHVAMLVQSVKEHFIHVRHRLF